MEFLKDINELSEFYWTNLFQRVSNLNFSKKFFLHNIINIYNTKGILFFIYFLCLFLNLNHIIHYFITIFIKNVIQIFSIIEKQNIISRK